jgi:AraC family L-rhamnose operon regulatory protein RhaS
MRFQEYEADTCLNLKKAWGLGEIELEALTRLSYPGRPMPAQMLKKVNSIGYWDAQTQQNWGLDWHRNEGLELTFLETGSLAFAMEGQQEISLRANDLTITRPWQMHKLGNPCVGVGRLYWIILDVDISQPHQMWRWPDWIILSQKDMEELTIILRQNEQPVWHGSQEMCNYFHRIGKAVKEDKEGDMESNLTILINELLLCILQMFRNGKILLDKGLVESMRSAELFLNELPIHLDREWTLESMAEYCGLGTTRFVHYCKKIKNMTPVHYLNYLRLRVAAEKLEKSPGMNISHIAYDCGFTSSQYFATTFKKHYGFTPKIFREHINKE